MSRQECTSAKTIQNGCKLALVIGAVISSSPVLCPSRRNPCKFQNSNLWWNQSSNVFCMIYSHFVVIFMFWCTLVIILHICTMPRLTLCLLFMQSWISLWVASRSSHDLNFINFIMTLWYRTQSWWIGKMAAS